MMHYEAIEMQTCRLSVFLEKVKFNKVMSFLRKKLISVTGSWLGSVHQVMDLLGKLLDTPETRISYSYWLALATRMLLLC